MLTISLQTGTALTEWSLSTLRRRINDGSVQCTHDKTAANKTRICFDSIKNHIGMALDAETVALIEKADAGDAAAQNDLAVFFLECDNARLAIYWLELAARRDFTDAMHLLGQCYLKGNGVAKDHNLALMWIARAAASGHPLAAAQVRSIRLG